MHSADLDVVKDIPGYKVILKAVLKSQIQQLVEQLASHTDEESVVLTASVSDGTLSHLGSDSGKGFLDDHDDMKSQFLGFCLKRHHRKKQQEKEQEEREAQQKAAAIPSPRPFRTGTRPYFSRGSRYFSRMHSPRHPSYQSGLSPGGVRHEPYRVPRPAGIRPSGPPMTSTSPVGASPVKPVVGNAASQAIKIEPDDEEDQESKQGLSDTNIQSESNIPSTDRLDQSSLSSYPNTPVKASESSETTPVKLDSVKDLPIKSDVSGDVAADFPEPVATDNVPGGLSLESDLSTLISPSTSAQNPSTLDTDPTNTSADVDLNPAVNVKLEAISESDMELEITGVEPGTVDPIGSQDSGWGAGGIPGGMGYDPSGATGTQADLAGTDQGYNMHQLTGLKDISCTVVRIDGMEVPEYVCPYCEKVFRAVYNYKRHVRLHEGIFPYQCERCLKGYADPSSLQKHLRKKTPCSQPYFHQAR